MCFLVKFAKFIGEDPGGSISEVFLNFLWRILINTSLATAISPPEFWYDEIPSILKPAIATIYNSDNTANIKVNNRNTRTIES